MFDMLCTKNMFDMLCYVPKIPHNIVIHLTAYILYTEQAVPVVALSRTCMVQQNLHGAT